MQANLRQQFTTFQNIIRLTADLCAFASILFWMRVMWTLVQPSVGRGTLVDWANGALDGTLATALALCCAFVMPTFWSALFPNSTAAQLLKDIRKETHGFVAIQIFTAFLTTFAAWIVFQWWYAKLIGVVPFAEGWALHSNEVVLVILLMVTTLIFFIGVLAWAWNQSTPVQWAAEVQQAYLVKRYRLQVEADLAALKLTLLEAQRVAAIRWSDMLPQEQQQLAQFGRALVTGINQTLGEIEHTLYETTGTLISLARFSPDVDDQADVVHYVAQSFSDMRDAGDWPAPASAPPRPASDAPQGMILHQDAVPASPPPLPPAVAVAAPPPPAAQRGTPPRYAAEYTKLRTAATLQGVWSARQLADALGKSDRTARDVITSWLDAGVVARGETKNSHYFTERAEVLR